MTHPFTWKRVSCFCLFLAGLLSAGSLRAECISPDAAAQGQSLPEGYRFPSGGSWYACKDNVWQRENAVSHPRPYSEDKSGSCLPLGGGFETKDGVVSMTYREERSRHSFFGKVHECVNGNWWQLPAGKVQVETKAPQKAPAPKAVPVIKAPPAIPEYPDELPAVKAPPKPKPAVASPDTKPDPLKQLEALEKMEAKPVPRSPAREVVSPKPPTLPDYEPLEVPDSVTASDPNDYPVMDPSATPVNVDPPQQSPPLIKSQPSPSKAMPMTPSMNTKLPPGSAEAPDNYQHSADYKQCLAHCTEGMNEGERAGIHKCKAIAYQKYGNMAWPEEGVKAFDRCRILAARKAKNQLNACLLPCRKQAQQYIWEGN